MSSPARHLVLTGASGPLGRALAGALAPSCSAMVLCGRNSARLQALQQKLDAMHPGLDIRTVPGDLPEPAVIDRLFDAARSLNAPPDLLVNAAGMGDFGALEEQDEAMIVRLLAVNLLAPIRVTQRLLPLLRSAPSAQIVNVGSIAGYLGYPGLAVHCATKFGLRGYTQALRRELADTCIRVRHFATHAMQPPGDPSAIDGFDTVPGDRDDSPEAAAEAFLRFLRSKARDSRIGISARVLVWLDRLAPMLVDIAIRQRPVTRRAAANRHARTPSGRIGA